MDSKERCKQCGATLIEKPEMINGKLVECLKCPQGCDPEFWEIESVVKEIRSIPAVARVLVEYEKIFGYAKGKEMWEILISQIESFLANPVCRDCGKPVSFAMCSDYAAKYKEDTIDY